MKDVFEIVGYASPSALIAALTVWQGLLRGTWFERPGIGSAPYATALLVGVLISFAVVIFWRHQKARFLRRVTAFAFIAAFAFLSACVALRSTLAQPWSPNATWRLETLWDTTYVAAMVAIFAFATLGAMAIGASIRQSGTPA
ncbi:hypothetical protein ABIA16_004619 [Sinorhizobium fredii]